MEVSVLRALADVVGPGHCLTGADRSPYVVEGRTPGAVVVPGTPAEVVRVVGLAGEASVPVIPWGGGTQMARGASPREGAVVVVTRRLARVLEHEPGDLTATAEAGITIDALQTALGGGGQWLPLDPPLPARATLGGVLATNAAGPRRHLYGTARDLVIGLRVVGADGAVVRAGGKVVKNVAGYDLTKLQIGALGTLGVIVEVTLKLRPRPETEGGLWAVFGDVPRAAAASQALLASDLVPHSVELLDLGGTELAARGAGAALPRGASVLVGFDGLPATVEWQRREAARWLREAGALDTRTLDPEATRRTLAAARDLGRATPDPPATAGVAVFASAAVPPAATGAYLVEAAAGLDGGSLSLASAAHAGEGVVRLVLLSGQGEPPEHPMLAGILERWRAAARARGGHLVVERAPLGVKEALSVWDPPGPAVRLMRAIKDRLDPRGLMNPGRFVGGI